MFPEVPEHLAECWIEDWVKPDEEQPEWSTEPWEFWARMRAFRRWADAVAGWMAEHEVPIQQQRQLVPWRRPRWRNPVGWA